MSNFISFLYKNPTFHNITRKYIKILHKHIKSVCRIFFNMKTILLFNQKTPFAFNEDSNKKTSFFGQFSVFEKQWTVRVCCKNDSKLPKRWKFTGENNVSEKQGEFLQISCRERNLQDSNKHVKESKVKSSLKNTESYQRYETNSNRRVTTEWTKIGRHGNSFTDGKI